MPSKVTYSWRYRTTGQTGLQWVQVLTKGTWWNLSSTPWQKLSPMTHDSVRNFSVWWHFRRRAALSSFNAVEKHSNVPYHQSWLDTLYTWPFTASVQEWWQNCTRSKWERLRPWRGTCWSKEVRRGWAARSLSLSLTTYTYTFSHLYPNPYSSWSISISSHGSCPSTVFLHEHRTPFHYIQGTPLPTHLAMKSAKSSQCPSCVMYFPP